MHQWDHLLKWTMKQGCVALTSCIVKVRVSMQLSVELKVWVKQTSFLRYPKGWKVPPSQAKSMSVSLKGWTASWMEAAPWGDTIVCSACTDVQCSSGGFLRCKSYCCHHRVPPLCLHGPTGTTACFVRLTSFGKMHEKTSAWDKPFPQCSDITGTFHYRGCMWSAAQIWRRKDPSASLAQPDTWQADIIVTDLCLDKNNALGFTIGMLLANSYILHTCIQKWQIDTENVLSITNYLRWCWTILFFGCLRSYRREHSPCMESYVLLVTDVGIFVVQSFLNY